MRTTPRELSREDVGWLAGIVDGEGSIHLKYYDQYPHFRYGVYLVNTNLELLEKCWRIITELSGDAKAVPSVSKKQYVTGIVGRKQCYQLQLRKIGTIISVLSAILPHLTEKRERAELLLLELTRHTKNARWKKERRARRD